MKKTRSAMQLVVALVFASVLASVLVSCGDDDDSSVTAANGDISCFPETAREPIDVESVMTTDISGKTVTLVAYDSFFLSEGTLEAFTEKTGATVEVLQSGDTGAMVAQAILTKGNPVADVMWGVDNTFVCRALEEDIFVPYATNADLLPDLLTDPEQRVTPVDFGDVCVNVAKADFSDPPRSFDDLKNEKFKDQLVVQNPETSSPGLAFLMATIAQYGDGWEDYWKDLRANGVTVTSGWSEAYYDEFSHSGVGDRGAVVSYATSPVAVIFEDVVPDIAPTGVITETCFRQYEYAGILAGTREPEAAAQLMDFLLSDTVQNDIPFNMFVFPATTTAIVPPEFEKYAELPAAPLTLDPNEIANNRDDWTARWVEIVLR